MAATFTPIAGILVPLCVWATGPVWAAVADSVFPDLDPSSLGYLFGNFAFGLLLTFGVILVLHKIWSSRESK